MKTTAIVIGILFAFVAVGWLAQGNDFFMFKVFAPKYEAVRRETFEQSKAYNQGMIQDLRHAQEEYIESTPDQQKALRSVILHRFADYDTDKLPPDLHSFYESLNR